MVIEITLRRQSRSTTKRTQDSNMDFINDFVYYSFGRRFFDFIEIGFFNYTGTKSGVAIVLF